MGDHAETLQIDYDPRRISYEGLLDIFWKAHNPTRRSRSRQYMSAIFYHNEKQKRLALQTRDREAAEAKTTIHTEILPFAEFTLAEDYHQKYYLRRNNELLKEYSALYPDTKDFIRSTAVTRVNGYLGGHGEPGDLEANLNRLGISPEAAQRLRDIFSGRRE